MDPIDLFFRAVGLFYLAGSYFGLRAILMDSVLDKALAALSASSEDVMEKRRRQIVGGFTIAFGAGGMALLLMNALAVPFFVVNLAAQGIWLVWARQFFVTEQDDDAGSVRQLSNAAILYAAATLGVVWLWLEGRLAPWDDPLALVLVATAAAGLAGWFFHHLSWKAKAADPAAAFAEERPQRIVIEPARWLWPLIDADTGMRFNHLTHLDDELAWRVEHWDDRFNAAFDPDGDTAAPVFTSPEDEADHVAEAQAIFEELAAAFGADNVSFGPDWLDRHARHA